MLGQHAGSPPGEDPWSRPRPPARQGTVTSARASARPAWVGGSKQQSTERLSAREACNGPAHRRSIEQAPALARAAENARASLVLARVLL